MTDLNGGDRSHLFNVLSVVEEGLRSLLAPDKMNLAELGTQVPHLHWHLIPPFSDDSHYPEPIWAAPLRPRGERKLPLDFPAVFGKLLKDRLGTPALPKS